MKILSFCGNKCRPIFFCWIFKEGCNLKLSVMCRQCVCWRPVYKLCLKSCLLLSSLTDRCDHGCCKECVWSCRVTDGRVQLQVYILQTANWHPLSTTLFPRANGVVSVHMGSVSLRRYSTALMGNQHWSINVLVMLCQINTNWRINGHQALYIQSWETLFKWSFGGNLERKTVLT